MANYYGNTDSTASGNSSFRIVCEYSASNRGNGYYRYTYRFYVQVTEGDFYGSTFSSSWGKTFSVNGTGKYGTSQYYTKDVAYGGSFTLGSTAWAGYTGSSTYRSQISGSTKIATAPRPTYTVKYNANGGSSAPASQTKTYGVTLKLSTKKPTRANYTFQGWATSASGSVKYAAGANYTANASVTLYAVWKINTHTVTFDANGGTIASTGQETYEKTVNHGSAVGTLPEAVKDYSNLLGWSASETNISYITSSQTITSDRTYYAIWETDSVIYVKNNGVWKRGVPYVKNNGVWKRGRIHIKAGDSWERGVGQ